MRGGGRRDVSAVGTVTAASLRVGYTETQNILEHSTTIINV